VPPGISSIKLTRSFLDGIFFNFPSTTRCSPITNEGSGLPQLQWENATVATRTPACRNVDTPACDPNCAPSDYQLPSIIRHLPACIRVQEKRPQIELSSYRAWLVDQLPVLANLRYTWQADGHGRGVRCAGVKSCYQTQSILDHTCDLQVNVRASSNRDIACKTLLLRIAFDAIEPLSTVVLGADSCAHSFLSHVPVN
jgi:hypothetical protein